MSPHISDTIGSDLEPSLPPPEGRMQRRFYGFYQERRGDYRFRTLPPLYFEVTRGLLDPLHPELGQNPDRQSLFGMLYYQRRSAKTSADVLFPVFWHVREDRSYLTAFGPFGHAESPMGNDTWLAPLFFTGAHAEKEVEGRSGYAVIPPLLTYSQWSHDSALTLSLPALYFRVRTGTDVQAGIVPFYFHGDNGNNDGARNTFTLVPPLFFYHAHHELEQSSLTVAGPVVASSDPFRDVLDVVPFVFHIQGKPESGGVREAHTTVFPFFHYGHTEEVSLVATPLFLYRKTHFLGHDADRNATTLVTPLYTNLTTRSGSASLELAGPVVPLWLSYRDRDTDQHTWAVLPFLFRNTSPTRNDYLTPLFGRFQNVGVSRTTWVFPTFTSTVDSRGAYETDFHPLVYVGADDRSSHTVVAPFYWDFADPDKRLTVGFPLFVRLADHKEDAVIEVVGNTLYTQKRTKDGLAWSFRVLPLFSYGQSPGGYFWDVLLGAVGFEKTLEAKYLKALWVPFRVGGPDNPRVAQF